MPTYFDAVLNENLEPVFNGTHEETHEYVVNSTSDPWSSEVTKNYRVCIGKTLEIVSLSEYLDRK